VEIESRGKTLASKALGIWKLLSVNPAAVKAAELEELKSRAARYSVDKVSMEPKVRDLFNELRREIMALDKDVVELCNEKSVTYRAIDYFVELIPRKNRLALLLNLDFDECDDPSGRARDATENAFVINACEDGGVLFLVRSKDDLASAMNLVSQAYERVSG
jgi:predicted transport protein